MVETIVRCPYCVELQLNAFMPMIDCFGGRFVCAKCGHVVMRASKTFRCRCRRCAEKDVFIPERARAGLARAG